MKLYYAPGACSLGIHVLLEEIGKPFEGIRVNLREGEQYQPGFVRINPKSKVPTLISDDGSVLTEFPAIAYYLARSNPGKHLLPEDADLRRGRSRRWIMRSRRCTCRASRACSGQRTSPPTRRTMTR